MKVQKEEKFYLQEKKLNKHEKELKNFEKIYIHLKSCLSYKELEASYVSKTYGFEYLKYELSGYCSMNLDKCGRFIQANF